MAIQAMYSDSFEFNDTQFLFLIAIIILSGGVFILVVIKDFYTSTPPPDLDLGTSSNPQSSQPTISPEGKLIIAGIEKIKEELDELKDKLVVGNDEENKQKIEKRIRQSSELFEEGDKYYNNYNYSEAINSYLQSIDIHPTMSAYINLGNCL